MELEIVHEAEKGYTIVLNGEFFRLCKSYSELATTVESLVKSKYFENAEGFI